MKIVKNQKMMAFYNTKKIIGEIKWLYLNVKNAERLKKHDANRKNVLIAEKQE